MKDVVDSIQHFIECPWCSDIWDDYKLDFLCVFREDPLEFLDLCIFAH